MAKVKEVFRCENCYAEYPKWQGRCAECGSWESIEPAKSAQTVLGSELKPVSLDEVGADGSSVRIKTGLDELDRVLGGGIVPGSLILLGGDPGIGKSTISLHLSSNLSRSGQNVLYVSGEESLDQIKLRSSRLGIAAASFKLLADNDVDSIVQTAAKLTPELLIIDSIQTMVSGNVPAAAGSMGQVGYASTLLQGLAKSKAVATLIVGHVTKDGNLAGPKQLEHLVDTVLYFEGESSNHLRILRSYKNRFGATSEVGIFEMDETGLSDVLNPSEIFTKERGAASPGSVVYPALEGTRPMLTEIEALTSLTSFGYPKRQATGVDMNRLQLMLAVLSRRLKMNVGSHDVYVSVAGGIKVSEPSADLAVALATVSSLKDKPVEGSLVAVGEIGLSGDIRPAPQLNSRLSEIAKMGYKGVIHAPTPKDRELFNKFAALKSIPVRTLKEAVDLLF